MRNRVLIVDDDLVWLRLVAKQFARYADRFVTLAAAGGRQALEVLRRQRVSLVVTDLQMPEMDGLTLLARLSAGYPDIPVIIMTAYSTPRAEQAVRASGAVGYIEKPFAVQDLADKILAALRRQSAGGMLQTIPLEVFVQLIEMEQKTCTIRVMGKGDRRRGALFFRGGELFDARVDDRQRETAAYEIFSWENVVLVIEDECPVRTRRIGADLQAVLFEALRRKDESRTPAEGFAEDPGEKQTMPPAPGCLDRLRADLQAAMGRGLTAPELGGDTGWDPLLQRAAALGRAAGAGALKTCYLDTGAAADLLLLPDTGETLVARVDPRCARERLLQHLGS